MGIVSRMTEEGTCDSFEHVQRFKPSRVSEEGSDVLRAFTQAHERAGISLLALDGELLSNLTSFRCIFLLPAYGEI